MGDPITIGYGQNKWVKDANTKIVTLAQISPAGTAQTLPNVETGAAYTVPVGKKYTVLVVTFGNIGGSSYITFVGPTGLDILKTKTSSTYPNVMKFITYVVFAAGTQPKGYTASGSGSIACWGVEEDA